MSLQIVLILGILRDYHGPPAPSPLGFYFAMVLLAIVLINMAISLFGAKLKQGAAKLWRYLSGRGS
jgi:hypothetical protein